jgi:UrcA family protein
MNRVNQPNRHQPIDQEIHMDTEAAIVNVSPVLAAAVLACTLFAGDAAAQGHAVNVAYQVSTQGLDLGTPAGARELYSRLKNAAWIVCTRANRVGLEPSPDPYACSEKALAEAIRSAHLPLLVQAYLQTHSLGQAAAHGIDVPVQMASK